MPEKTYSLCRDRLNKKGLIVSVTYDEVRFAFDFLFPGIRNRDVTADTFQYGKGCTVYRGMNVVVCLDVLGIISGRLKKGTVIAACGGFQTRTGCEGFPEYFAAKASAPPS